MTYLVRRLLPGSILVEVTRSLEAVKREIRKGKISKLEKPEHCQEESRPVPGSPAAFLIDVGAIYGIRNLVVVVARDRPGAKPEEEGASVHLGRRRVWRDKHQSTEPRISVCVPGCAVCLDGNTLPQAD